MSGCVGRESAGRQPGTLYYTLITLSPNAMPLWLSIFEAAVRFLLPYRKLSTRALSQRPHMPTDQCPNRQGRGKHRGLSTTGHAQWCRMTQKWDPLQELNSDILRWGSHRNVFKSTIPSPAGYHSLSRPTYSRLSLECVLLCLITCLICVPCLNSLLQEAQRNSHQVTGRVHRHPGSVFYHT